MAKNYVDFNKLSPNQQQQLLEMAKNIILEDLSEMHILEHSIYEQSMQTIIKRHFANFPYGLPTVDAPKPPDLPSKADDDQDSATTPKEDKKPAEEQPEPKTADVNNLPPSDSL